MNGICWNFNRIGVSRDDLQSTQRSSDMTTREEETAYYLGRQAVKEGQSENSNPYDREADSHLWRWWEMGWKESIEFID